VPGHAREAARNAELFGGRSMIAMGVGTNHWHHSDQIYRTFLSLLMLGGCEGVNSGGRAQSVGVEGAAPLRLVYAVAHDWARPTRQVPATPYWHLASDQCYEGSKPTCCRARSERVASPVAR